MTPPRRVAVFEEAPLPLGGPEWLCPGGTIAAMPPGPRSDRAAGAGAWPADELVLEGNAQLVLNRTAGRGRR